jgi:peptidoglycan/xylan/chitin deacetylase (PgdA/CDA1 family)
MVVYLMMRIPERSLSLQTADGRMQLPFASDWKSRRRSGRLVQEHLKLLPVRQILELVDDWTSQFSSYVDSAEFSLSRILDWTQIRSMDGHGFEFGSHSVTHAILSHLDDRALEAELAGSKATLEAALGHEVPTIAYPVGKEFAYSERVKQATAEAGYDLGAAYIAGINDLRAPDKFALRRQNIERHHTLGDFAAMMLLPAWIQ